MPIEGFAAKLFLAYLLVHYYMGQNENLWVYNLLSCESLNIVTRLQLLGKQIDSKQIDSLLKKNPTEKEYLAPICGHVWWSG